MSTHDRTEPQDQARGFQTLVQAVRGLNDRQLAAVRGASIEELVDARLAAAEATA